MSFLCCCFSSGNNEEEQSSSSKEPLLSTTTNPPPATQQLSETSMSPRFGSPERQFCQNLPSPTSSLLTFGKTGSMAETQKRQILVVNSEAKMRNAESILKREERSTEQPSLKHSMTVSYIDVRGGMMSQMRTSRSAIRMETLSIRTSKRSALWNQDSGTKIIYISTRKDEEMVMALKLTQLCPIEDTCLSYLFTSRRGIHKNVIPGQEPSLVLIISDRPPCEIKASYHARGSPGQVRTVFGVLKNQQQQIQSPRMIDNDDIIETVYMGSSCLRLDIFDSIVIKMPQTKQFESLLEFSLQATHSFELQELKRVIWVLPSDTTLSQLGTLLARQMRRFLLTEPIEKVLSHLSWQLQLLCGQKFGQVMVVRHDIGATTGSYQVKVELAIALLLVEVNANNAKIYQNFIDTFFTDITTLEYLQYVSFLKRSKGDPNPLEQLKRFSTDEMRVLQNSNRIDPKQGQNGERWITFKTQFKNAMKNFMTDYKHSQTPIEEYIQPKDWDDKLATKDMLVGTLQVEQHYSQDEFEQIEDESIQGADLDIINDIIPASSLVEQIEQPADPSEANSD